MLRRVFLDHPHEVGETYGEHFRVASGFAGELLLAGLACAVHAVAPCFCKKTGSRAVASLHDRMIVNRCPHSRSVDLKTQPGLTGL